MVIRQAFSIWSCDKKERIQKIDVHKIYPHQFEISGTLQQVQLIRLPIPPTSKFVPDTHINADDKVSRICTCCVGSLDAAVLRV